MVCLLSVSAIAQNGQLPNVGFENWDTIVAFRNPEHWNGANIWPENTIRSTDAYHGNYSLLLKNNVKATGMAEPTLIHMGNSPNYGFIYSDTITAMHGYYKCSLTANEVALINVRVFSNGVFYETNHQITGNVNTWTHFTFPLTHSTPDSLMLQIYSNITLLSTDPDSWLMLDSLAFSNAGGATPQPIPNFSFEDWRDIEVINPVGWHSYNDFLASFDNQSVFQSTDAYEGSYSAEIRLVNDRGSPLPYEVALTLAPIQYGWMFNGANAGVPYFAQPAMISGFYKNTDSIPGKMHLEFFTGGVSQLQIIEPLPQHIQFGHPAYRYFSRNINLPIQPDSIFLYFKTGKTVGKSLFLDEVKFTGGNVSVVKNTLSDDWKIYPNPTSDVVFVEMGIIDEAVYIEMLDTRGRVAKSTQFAPGTATTVTVDVSDLAPGVYLYRVNGVSKGKFLVQR